MGDFPPRVPSFRTEVAEEEDGGRGPNRGVSETRQRREGASFDALIMFHFHLSLWEAAGCDHSGTKIAASQDKPAADDRLFPLPKTNHSQAHSPLTSWLRSH